MHSRKQQWILVFIAGVIGFTLVTQMYWNYKNYQVGKRQLMNDVQTSLDKAVDTYYVELAKERSLQWKGDSIKLEQLDLDSIWINRDTLTGQGKTITLKGYDSGTRTIKGYQQGSVTLKGVQTDSSRSTFIPLDASSVGLERIHLNTLLDSLKDPIESLSTRIVVSFREDKLSLQQIDSLFRTELDLREIAIEYGLKNEKLIGEADLIRPEIIETASLVTRAKSPYFVYGNTLSAHYSNITLAVLKKNVAGILISFFLLAGVIASLVYLLGVIRRQKQLAEVKNDLISNITHEFKTPIATIRVALEAIQSFNDRDPDERTSRYVDMSAQQLEKLNNMVEKLLETATLDSEELVLNREQVNLTELLDTLVHSEHLAASDKEVSFESGSPALSARVDRFHFENALANILDNALKYGGDEIVVGIHDTAKGIVITISDSGNSLKPDQAKRLFDKFYRVPRGNTHDVKGFGIGLYYTRTIVEKHGGRIELQTQPRTTFTILLPHEH